MVGTWRRPHLGKIGPRSATQPASSGPGQPHSRSPAAARGTASSRTPRRWRCCRPAHPCTGSRGVTPPFRTLAVDGTERCPTYGVSTADERCRPRAPVDARCERMVDRHAARGQTFNQLSRPVQLPPLEDGGRLSRWRQQLKYHPPRCTYWEILLFKYSCINRSKKVRS